MNKIILDNKILYYQVFYKKIKHIYLRVKPDKSIYITCPYRTSSSNIEGFILKNKQKILKHISILEQKQPLYLKDEMDIFGVRYKIKYVLNQKKNNYNIVDNVSYKTQLMKSRYGSCIPKKRIIKLNTLLARFKEKYLKTILIHELIHLEVHNHQEEFYYYMNKLVPQYKIIKKELQELTRKYVI
ncbi:MAG: hypothetical protein B6I17_03805 [Tenericutes bacterium 4572_104]|nr:MAG: hypothetical protein B6I17_03805 [Tenericutes bacterium 4572_104]